MAGVFVEDNHGIVYGFRLTGRSIVLCHVRIQPFAGAHVGIATYNDLHGFALQIIRRPLRIFHLGLTAQYISCRSAHDRHKVDGSVEDLSRPACHHLHWQVAVSQDNPQQHACQLVQPANFLNDGLLGLVAVSHTDMLAFPIDPPWRAQNGEASLALAKMGARQQIKAKQAIAKNFCMAFSVFLGNLRIHIFLLAIVAIGFTRSGERDFLSQLR